MLGLIYIKKKVGGGRRAELVRTVKFAEGGVKLVEIKVSVAISVVIGQHVRQGTLFGQLRQVLILRTL